MMSFSLPLHGSHGLASHTHLPIWNWALSLMTRLYGVTSDNSFVRILPFSYRITNSALIAPVATSIIGGGGDGGLVSCFSSLFVSIGVCAPVAEGRLRTRTSLPTDQIALFLSLASVLLWMCS